MKERDTEGNAKSMGLFLISNKKLNSFVVIPAFRNDFNFNRTLIVPGSKLKNDG